MDKRDYSMVTRKTRKYILLTLFVGALLARIWQLQKMPDGLNLQEVGMGYDAFCIANFGVDRYTYSFPMYFMGYGRGQGTIYTYLVAFLIHLFGSSIWVIRIPMVCISMITMFIGMQLIREMGLESIYECFFCLFYGIMPVFVTTSRIGDPSNIIAFFVVLTTYMLICALKTNMKRYWILGGITCGLSLYSSGIAILVLPFFSMGFIIYVLWCRETKLNRIALFLTPILLASMPVLLLLYINYRELDSIVVCKVTFPNLFGISKDYFQLFDTKSLDMAISKVFGYDQNEIFTKHQYGLLTWTALPFSLLGIIVLFKKMYISIKKRKITETSIVILWIVAFFAGVGFIYEMEIDTWALYGIYVPILISCIYGLRSAINGFPGRTGLIIGYGVAAGIVIQSSMFLNDYFLSRGETQLFQPVFLEAMEYIREQPNSRQKKMYLIGYQGALIYYDFSAGQNPFEPVPEIRTECSEGIDQNGIYIVPTVEYNTIEALKDKGLSHEIAYENYRVIY